MRFTLSILIWLLLCPLSAYLQTIAKDGYKSEQIIYEGKIVDKETGEILPFANVTHIYELDSLIVRNYIADKEGRFKISVPRLMNNRIEITCMGYKILTRILSEAGKGTQINKYSTHISMDKKIGDVYNKVNLGVLKLEPDIHALDEVTVKARLELFRYNGDTLLVFPRNVKQMEGDALIDLLKRHPSFRVSENGDIYVEGKRIERAMLNGKHVFGEQVKTMVNSIMAKEAGLIKVYDEIDEVSEIIHGSERAKKRKVMNVITFKDFNLFKGGDVALESGLYSEKDDKGDHPLMRRISGSIGQYADKFRISGKGNYNKAHYPQKQKDALLGFNAEISSPDLLKQFNVKYDYEHKNLNQNSWTELLYSPTSYFEEQISTTNTQNDTKGNQHLYHIDGKYVKKNKYAVEFMYIGSYSVNNEQHFSTSNIEREGQKLSFFRREREFSNESYKNYLNLRIVPQRGKAGSVSINFSGHFNKGEGDGVRLDSTFTNGIINKRIYTLTSDRPEIRMSTRVGHLLSSSYHFSNEFRINYNRSGNRNLSVDQYTELIDSILSRDDVNKSLSLSYNLSFDIISQVLGANIRYTHIEDQIEERFPSSSFINKKFNTINYGLTFRGLKIIKILYSTSDNRLPIHYFSSRLNDNDPMNLSSGNPDLKMGKTHQVDIQFVNLLKYLNDFRMNYQYITNPVLYVRHYFPENTSLSEYSNYEVLAGATLSRPIHAKDYHQFDFRCQYASKRGAILWRSTVAYNFENPNIDILGTLWDSKRNIVRGSLVLNSNFSPSVRLDVQYGVSYNCLSVSGNSDYDNAIVGHDLTCNAHLQLLGRCFFRANYNYKNSYNTRLKRTQQINRLDASLDFRVFSDRKGVISLNARNVFNSRPSITETVEDLGMRSVYNPTNSTLFTVSFKYKFGVEQ